MDVSIILSGLSLFASIILGLVSWFMSRRQNEYALKLHELDWLARTQKAGITIFFKVKHHSFYDMDGKASSRTIRYLVVKNMSRQET